MRGRRGGGRDGRDGGGRDGRDGGGRGAMALPRLDLTPKNPNFLLEGPDFVPEVGQILAEARGRGRTGGSGDGVGDGGGGPGDEVQV